MPPLPSRTARVAPLLRAPALLARALLLVSSALVALPSPLAAQGDKRKAGIYLDKVRDKYPDSEAADEAKKIKL